MWQRFSSSSVHKVDSKGRVSVPALFRRVLEQGETPGLVIIPKLRGENCIEGFTNDYMERIAAQIAKMKPFSKPRRKLEYQFLAKAVPMQLDDTGRIVLPAAMRAQFGITDQVCFVGLGDSFQIWAPNAYEAMLAELEDDDEDALDALPWDEGDDNPFGDD